MGSGIMVWEGRNRRAPEARRVARRAPLVAGLLLLASMPLAGPLSAQLYGPRLASRAELTAMLDSLEQERAVATGKRADELSRVIQGIRGRLEQGDIDPGDAVLLRVTGQEPLTDTFTVTPARTLEIRDLEPIPLDGVLHSEAPSTVAEAIGRYVREPQVRLDVLKRVAILGAVQRPGFYHVPGSALVSDAVMVAGGPARDGRVQKLRVRRQGERVQLEQGQIAFRSRSLDQLGIVSGDELFVPQKGTSPWTIGLSVLGGITSIIFLVTRF